MERGALVQQRTDGAIGIVISVNGLDAEVLFGDGLREIVDVRMLGVVQFKRGAEIPACFVEMVDAYVRERGFG